MLVAKFPCPECHALLTPAVPQPSGVKLKCPRCSRVIVVPSSPVEEVEEVEAQPERKRVTSRRRDEDEEDRPSRRRDAREDEEDERPRNQRKRPKKVRRGGSGMKVAILVGVGLVVLIGASVGGYFLVTAIQSGELSNPRLRPINQATSALTGVHDQASAQVARSTLVPLGQRLREYHEQDMAAMANAKMPDSATIQKAVDEAMRNPEKAKADWERHEKEMLPMKTATEKLIKEVASVNKVPGGKELLESFWAAWGDGGKWVKFSVGMEEMSKEFDKSTPENFRKINVGMTEKEVTDILGKPFLIDTAKPGVRKLAYPVGFVDIKDGKVASKFGVGK